MKGCSALVLIQGFESNSFLEASCPTIVEVVNEFKTEKSDADAESSAITDKAGSILFANSNPLEIYSVFSPLNRSNVSNGTIARIPSNLFDQNNYKIYIIYNGGKICRNVGTAVPGK